jgi:hypothetical protein
VEGREIVATKMGGKLARFSFRRCEKIRKAKFGSLYDVTDTSKVGTLLHRPVAARFTQARI